MYWELRLLRVSSYTDLFLHLMTFIVLMYPNQAFNILLDLDYVGFNQNRIFLIFIITGADNFVLN